MMLIGIIFGWMFYWRSEYIFVFLNILIYGELGVKYRGFLINDEEFDLNEWWVKYNGWVW